MNQVHVIGAGLAGLSAALSLSAAGRQVVIHEAGPAAGGRCRSYFDRELDLKIDNGNHLLLSGNRAAFAYIDEIGSRDRFHLPRQARFPFVDLKTGDRWTLRPNRGPIPWWILLGNRRVPDTRLADYLGMAGIVRIKDDTVVAESMRRGRLYWRLVEPLAIAALNTRPQAALARSLGAVMRETLARGGKACIPTFPTEGLSDALIDPAISLLESRGATVHFSHRVGRLTIEADRVTALRVGTTQIDLVPGDAVVLAVPPWVAADLLPDLTVPDEFEAILNVHFRVNADPDGPAGDAGFVGVLEGAAEWVFVKPNHVSVTISAANRMVDDEARAIAATVWPNVCAALDIAPGPGEPIPPFRVVKEKRATFAATAEQEVRRPAARTRLVNLALAGDWTATGLPATIEGAIRSGRTAARVLLDAV
ncbi:MAG: hydroxysqualene dehydroxylase HpnE [Acetobacteraceae bacterium]